MDTFEIYQKSIAKGSSLPLFQENASLNAPDLYRPSEALMGAVNVAIFLGKPLLLTGEPGTGKTQLASHLAHVFGQTKGRPLVFNTRTTSTATDLFYRYDTLRHFQYSQNSQNRELLPDEIETKFIRYQALGKAIMASKRQIVLIDEIDKAPRDLPNDILNVLEDLEFEVPEIGKKYQCAREYRPLIIMTSNSEKNLPDAFLRRCVYHHLNFPTEAELMEILTSKMGTGTFGEKNMRELVVPHFMRVRKECKRKKPATSELLYWVSVLEQLGFPAEKLADGAQLDKQRQEQLLISYAVLAKNQEDLHDLKRKLEQNRKAA